MGNVVKKNKEGYGYCYTDLAQIHEYLESINARYYQYVDRIDNDDYIMTVPIIDGVEKPPRRGVRIVDAVLNGIKNPAQEQGSATTYARRYSLLMAFGLATDDDDGASLTKNPIKTKEDAEKYIVSFGKHKDKTIKQVLAEDEWYAKNYLMNSAKDENVKQAISMLTGAEILTDEEQGEAFDLMNRMNNLVMETATDYEELLKHFGVSSNSDMNIVQLRQAVAILEEKKKRGLNNE